MKGYRLLHSSPAVVLAVGLAVVFTMQLGCSTVKKKLQETQRVEVTSDPAGADVQSVSGEKLGTTPLVFEDEQLKKISKDGQLNLILSAPGYMQREVLLDIHGKDTHQVQLYPYDANYFSERLIHDFPTQANAMARGLVEIQSMVFARKLQEAERALENYQRLFPNIAASYVLAASVESLRGNNDKAKRYLMRARTIDPLDPVAARMLAHQKPGTGSTTARAPASQSPQKPAPKPVPKPAPRRPASAPATAPAAPPAGDAPPTAPVRPQNGGGQ